MCRHLLTGPSTLCGEKLGAMQKVREGPPLRMLDRKPWETGLHSAGLLDFSCKNLSKTGEKKKKRN